METISKRGYFDPQEFNLPPMSCDWLDGTLDMSINFHKVENGSALTVEDGTPKQQYGADYPIVPKIDREGHIFSTFQPQLIGRIIRQREQLINNSGQCLTAEWVLDLRSLINDIISLLDITLIQTYIKAEYSPAPGWTFDKKTLGKKHNRKMLDKINWIRQITGKQIGIEGYLFNLNSLRMIRNHLNHFDPPTFVLTIEEAVKWINDTSIIGLILVKIRQALGVPVSESLLNFVLQKEALFNPEEAFRANRVPIKDGQTGYRSGLWKTDQDD